ncbi:MAG TPA: hypothetical protein VNQ73_08040 [Ilumatobacter sp.]|nr:hypothetical protein [Ilumatobacter sp.]
MQQQKLTLSNLLVGVGGLVAFIFSFLKFFKFPGGGFNAWDTDAFAFVSTIPAILGLAAVVWVALDLFGVKLPDHVLTFNPAQLKATWGISATGMMVAWLTTDADKGPGFWLMLIGSLAMGVGAVLGLLGVGNDPLASATPAPPAAPTPAAPSAPPPPAPPGDPTPPPPPPPTS